jgi:hypothetical protein
MSSLLQHALDVNSGNRTVFSLLFAGVAIAASSQAGRVGEDGSGAMWVATELLAPPPSAATCSQPTQFHAEELVFETIMDRGELDWATSGVLAGKAVLFDWNGRTGELTYAGATAAGIFRDLENPIRRSSLTRSCGPG